MGQPPPQALRFSHGRGERETRVTGDEPQGTMGRVQTGSLAPSRPLSPSRLLLCANFHRKREVWVRGRFCGESNWEAEGQNQKLTNRILFNPNEIRMCFILWIVLLWMKILQFFLLFLSCWRSLIKRGKKFSNSLLAYVLSNLLICMIYEMVPK